MSTDLHTLSGAYAIDALSEEEARQFDRHLEECPSCREEVRELRAAAAKMGAAEALAPPPALKARVLAAAGQIAQLPPRVTRRASGRQRPTGRGSSILCRRHFSSRVPPGKGGRPVSRK